MMVYERKLQFKFSADNDRVIEKLLQVVLLDSLFHSVIVIRTKKSFPLLRLRIYVIILCATEIEMTTIHR